MSQPYLGELRLFAGSFAPLGWAFCDGSPLPISENDALFNLLGTTFGGDGQETFNLPDLRSRVPIHQGTGPGLQTRALAEAAGTEQVTLTVQQTPTHTHTAIGTSNLATTATPGDTVVPAVTASSVVTAYAAPSNLAALNAQMLTPAGGSQPHENMQPFLAVNYIISLFGIYPSPT